MKIALVQMSSPWADTATGCRLAEKLILSSPGADLYVLPEMFATGFVMNPTPVAEPASGGPTLAAMQKWASRTGAAVAGTLAVTEGGRFYNRFCFVEPDGTTAFCDKRHLFAYGGENRCYTPGTRRVTVLYKGFRIRLFTCYDLRFPVWSRNGDGTGCEACGEPGTPYDMALYAACWPASRAAVWQTLLRARAIENQCYVVGVNRSGSDPVCAYDGLSAVIDPKGRTLVQAPSGAENTVMTATADLPSLQAFREKFPVLRDADAFTL